MDKPKDTHDESGNSKDASNAEHSQSSSANERQLTKHNTVNKKADTDKRTDKNKPTETNMNFIEKWWHFVVDPQNSGAVIAIFTVVIAVTGIFYTAFAAFQWRATRSAADAATNANKIARESLIGTQRAFIAFDKFDTRNIVLRQGGEDKRILAFSAKLRNDGNTPAVDVINSFTIAVQNSEPTNEELIRVPKRSDYFPTFVGSKGEHSLGPESRSDVDLLGFKLPGTMKEVVETKLEIKRNVFFFGWVAYRDVFPETKIHVMEFCHQLRGVALDSKSTPDNPIYNFAFTACRAHNCTDEYCENYKQMEALALGK